MSVWSQSAAYARQFSFTRDYFRSPLTVGEARALVEQTLAVRAESFLQIADRFFYANPANPYHKLLNYAGIDAAKLRLLVEQNGLEGALSRLFDAGVYITLDEFKGRCPVSRPGLEFKVSGTDFNNPTAGSGVQWSSSGSRGNATQYASRKEVLTFAAAYLTLMTEAFGLHERIYMGWRPETFTFLMIYIKSGKAAERWFTQRRWSRTTEGYRTIGLELLNLLAARTSGRRSAWPKFVDRQNAIAVARWVAGQKRKRGRLSVIDTNVTSAVRVCIVSAEKNLDIAGTIFRIGGEPYTPGKAKILESAGASAINFYGMTEYNWPALGCAAPKSPDDMHLATDRLAFVTKPRVVGAGAEVDAIYITNTLATNSKLTLNVEAGDYGRIEERDCGCLWSELGLRQHIMNLRSYEKLTSEGVTFTGGDLFHLLDEVLPARFGGSPIDYQILEEEDSGLPKVSILVAPAIGPVEEADVITTVLETLEKSPHGGSRLMADQWRQGRTLRVIRREPYTTKGSKILPLHVLRDSPLGATPGS